MSHISIINDQTKEIDKISLNFLCLLDYSMDVSISCLKVVELG